ncbi:carbohydrate ABC transporter permease [Dactylosporangium sp. NPDC000244]|uniref:carbohydrate ABC transporter permease n=1 Tax=Dactylosporangium sp. NPDC000244 TaxID=3154365 RepID=UPI0033308E14
MSRRLLIALLAAGALFMIFPFVWTVVTSITVGGDVLTTPRLIPERAGLDGYRKLFEFLPFWRIALNSLVLAVVSTALLLITSSTAAYAFARLEFPGKNVVFVGYLATLMIPMQVLVVPLFIEIRALDLVDTYASLIVPTIASAFGVFLLRQSVAVLPRELDEAAFVDGAGHIRIFLRIILPLIRPALATYGLFAFMSSWNAFLWPLVAIRSREFMTLPLGLSTLSGQYSNQWNAIMAGSVVSIVPMLVLYALAQKHIVQSVANAGLK